MTAAILTRTTRHARLASAVRAFEEHEGLPPGTYATAPAVGDVGTHLHLRDTTGALGLRKTIVAHTWGECTHQAVLIYPKGVAAIRRRLASIEASEVNQ